jgi:hypothetical protein
VTVNPLARIEKIIEMNSSDLSTGKSLVIAGTALTLLYACISSELLFNSSINNVKF